MVGTWRVGGERLIKKAENSRLRASRYPTTFPPSGCVSGKRPYVMSRFSVRRCVSCKRQRGSRSIPCAVSHRCSRRRTASVRRGRPRTRGVSRRFAHYRARSGRLRARGRRTAGEPSPRCGRLPRGARCTGCARSEEPGRDQRKARTCAPTDRVGDIEEIDARALGSDCRSRVAPLARPWSRRVGGCRV